jgi:hypothetical protein
MAGSDTSKAMLRRAFAGTTDDHPDETLPVLEMIAASFCFSRSS